MLASGEKLYAYPFDGYWKDVGTINSLWEANMDLLGENPKFDITDRSWRIFFRNNALAPQFIGENARISNSIISEGCEIYGTVENSVLFNSIKVEAGAVIRDSVVFSNVTVQKDAEINYSIIDSDTMLETGCKVGEPKDSGKDVSVIGSGLTIKANTVIPGSSMINSLNVNETEGK